MTDPTAVDASLLERRLKRRVARRIAVARRWCAAWPSVMLAQSAGPLPYRPGIDVLDYAFTFDLPDRGSTIAARAVLAVRRTLPVDTLVLDLVSLRVDSVLVNAQPVAF